MMDEKMMKKISKWVMHIILCILLIYLAISHLSEIAACISWLAGKTKSLWIGCLIAVILNVPMQIIEAHLPAKKRKRIWSILLSLVLTLGTVVLLMALVIPEFINALRMLSDIVLDFVDQLALMTQAGKESNWWAETFSQFDLDWTNVKVQLESWLQLAGGNFMNAAVDVMKSFTGHLVTFFIGLVFAIYLLAKKEIYLQQLHRLMTIWIPTKVHRIIVKTTKVFYTSFNQFLIGQCTEAVILGVLCTIGMAILRIPYSPMIGALIGVTALIPYLGAFIGLIVGGIMISVVDPFKAIEFIIFLLILQQIEGNIIYPKVVGARISVSPIWVFVGVTLGGSFAGPMGMFFGVPIVSSVVLLVKEGSLYKEKKGLNP
ncbi:MAG: AI-2E family transporter [Erysipelotrichaceae bacterium]|nr:AI-2E family transporter [Erysipelotrichaceae bacterium]